MVRMSSCSWGYPHSLSYFNEVADGRQNGPRHSFNRNFNWGQERLFLERWIKHRAADTTGPVHREYYNYDNPLDLEIEHIEAWPLQRDRVGDPPQVPAEST